MTRVFVCVLDGCGAGALPDAAAYGDAGSTLRHVLERSGVRLPNLAGLGLGEVVGLPLGAPWPEATYGRLVERGAGKDTTTGHWEMMGVVLERPFPTYPQGFPADVIGPSGRYRPAGALQPACLRHRHHRGARRRTRGHRPAHRLHVGRSVFQIACHEAVVPVPSCTLVRDRARHPAGPPRGGRVIRARSTARRAPTRARRGAATSPWSRRGRRI